MNFSKIKVIAPNRPLVRKASAYFNGMVLKVRGYANQAATIHDLRGQVAILEDRNRALENELCYLRKPAEGFNRKLGIWIGSDKVKHCPTCGAAGHDVPPDSDVRFCWQCSLCGEHLMIQRAPDK